MDIRKIKYWIEDDDYLYSFKSKRARDNYVKESNTVLRSQLVPDGLRIFETEIIYEGTINKYKIIDPKNVRQFRHSVCDCRPSRQIDSTDGKYCGDCGRTS